MRTIILSAQIGVPNFRVPEQRRGKIGEHATLNYPLI
jgi:hypothetical protein